MARQYCGTAGGIENCQAGVFLSYPSRWGYTLIDRGLYLPRPWAEDQARRAKAQIPADNVFITKPEMARAMIADAPDAGVPRAFVLGDALYGSDRQLRRLLEACEQAYVLAVRSNETLRVGCRSLELIIAEALAATLEPRDWYCHAAGEGAEVPRQYDWGCVQLHWLPAQGWQHLLLIRRNRRNPAERAYYIVFAAASATTGWRCRSALDG